MSDGLELWDVCGVERGADQVSTTDLGLGHCYSWYSANPP